MHRTLHVIGVLLLATCLLAPGAIASETEEPVLLYIVEIAAADGASIRNGWFLVPLGERFSINMGERGSTSSFAMELEAERIDEDGRIVTALSVLAVEAQPVAASTKVKCEPGVRTQVGSVSTAVCSGEVYLTVAILPSDYAEWPILVAADFHHLGDSATPTAGMRRVEAWLEGSPGLAPTPTVRIHFPTGYGITFELGASAKSGIVLGVFDRAALGSGIWAFAGIDLVRMCQPPQHGGWKLAWRAGLESAGERAYGRVELSGDSTEKRAFLDIGVLLVRDLWALAGIGAAGGVDVRTSFRVGLAVDF